MSYKFPPPDPALGDPAGLASMLVRGDHVPDSLFDLIYPPPVQDASDIHWTPVGVVEEAVRLLQPGERTRVLDVGSGPGKFCSIAALIAPGHYTGVERKPALHQVAVESKLRLGAERANFILGNAFDLDWTAFDVLYFYNPFQELISMRPAGVPGVGFGPEVWDRHVRIARKKLLGLPLGRRVVLFHGLGEDLPDGFRRIAKARSASVPLEVWRKEVAPAFDLAA